MNLTSPRAIWQKAQNEVEPTFTIMAFSGGNDSLATYHAARAIGITPDAILHVNTRTGIPEVATYCRDFAEREGIPYVEADAGTAFEDYVLRKGYFGRGNTAHTYAYHVLKAGPLRKALSEHFRQGQRGVRIALLNGARTEESARRARGKPEPINKDPSGENYWVSLIHDWTKIERDEFLESIPNLYRNPVATTLCRSGECFCVAGDTQIHTPNGWQEIESINVGDEITNYTNGKPTTAKVAVKHDSEIQETITLKPAYLLPLEVTGNHELYVRPFTRKRIGTKLERIYKQPRYVPAADIHDKVAARDTQPYNQYEGHYIGFPIPTTESPTDLTTDQAKLLGYFISEGAYLYRGDKHRGIIFTVGKNKSTAMAAEIQRCIHDGLGLNTDRRDWTDKRTGRELITVRCGATASSEFMLRYMQGRYSHEKAFRPNIMHAPLDTQRTILETMWEGDGSDYAIARTDRADEATHLYSTTSKRLALQVQEMMLRRGEIYGIRTRDRGDEPGNRFVYQIAADPGVESNRHAFIENDVMWTRINSVGEPSKQPTYNLTVDGEPNYLTHAGLVHNCGTMQQKSEIAEAEFYYPKWSKEMRHLEALVLQEGFTWGWGDDVNDIKAQLDDGAQLLFDDHMTMCVSCQSWADQP